jgi:hypothetical protein
LVLLPAAPASIVSLFLLGLARADKALADNNKTPP